MIWIKKKQVIPKSLNLNHDNKVNNANRSRKKKDNDLPWWVELVFVQIGLPDKLLIKILKPKENQRTNW